MFENLSVGDIVRSQHCIVWLYIRMAWGLLKVLKPGLHPWVAVWARGILMFPAGMVESA